MKKRIETIPTLNVPQRRGRRVAARRLHLARILMVAAMSAVITSVVYPVDAQEAPASYASDFREIDKLRVDAGDLEQSFAEKTGWLVLNSKSRRAYLFFNEFRATTVQSFDLDTLKPIRRVTFQGFALTGGLNNAWPSGYAGELIYALDEDRRQIYFALHDAAQLTSFTELPKDNVAGPTSTASPDGQIATSRFVALDEDAFNGGHAEFAASFRSPADTDHVLWLRSLAVVPRTKPEEPSRLAVLWTAPQHVAAPVHHHQLVVWDVSTLSKDADPTLETPTRQQPIAAPPLVKPITACAGGPMTYGPPGSYHGTYQWGMLVRPDGAYLGCQTRIGSAKVVFVPFGDGTQLSYPLSRPVSDVLVDPEGGRLLMKSLTLGGVTWWVFEAATNRFSGSVAALLTPQSSAAGLDASTGRLYTAFDDYSTLTSGRSTPVEGGIFSVDTRLDPVPALEPRNPDVTTTSGVFKIVVDPPTKRVFVLRGIGTQQREEFYRVYRDDRPPAVHPPGPDDRRFTVDSKEKDGVTQASYQGNASGYGSRILLVGGIAAATDRDRARQAQSACTTGDRELAVGQVEATSLSHVSAAATAAALAGDPDTEEQSGAPVERCWPEAFDGDPRTDDRRPKHPTEKDEGGNPRPLDTKELAFDSDPDGENPGSDYRVQCVGQDNPEAQKEGFTTKVPQKDGFTTKVLCDEQNDKVTADATGKVFVQRQELPAVEVQGARAPAALGVTVGYASTHVDVHRRSEGGLVATVDSIARDVDIEGIGHIGVVRTVAVSEAGGRGGTARTTFRRSICGVDFPSARLTRSSCLSEEQQEELVATFNQAMSGRAELRLRRTDPALAKGSQSGYAAAVQRDRLELFADRVITRDNSLAVPGLEIVSFRGDHQDEGAGRQIVQLAGVQAGTSYGIACVYGQTSDGSCATSPVEVDPPLDPPPPTVDEDGNLVATSAGGDGGNGSGGRTKESILERILRFPARLLSDVLRLLFSSPREFGLMAAVWALLYAPCYLGERRRTLRSLGARRLAPGAAR